MFTVAPMLISTSGGTPPSDPLFDLIMSLSPAFYCRHGEPSGSTMENEVSADGTYSATANLAQASLYSGGPTSVVFSGSNSGGTMPFGVLPASSAPGLTLLTIMNPAAISGQRHIISRDADTGTRIWQWRLNGTDMEFYKIVGGVEGTVRAHGLSADVPAMVGATVTTAGVVSLFVNGARLGTTNTIAAANYGTDDLPVSINIRVAGEGTSNGFSESSGWGSALSDAQMLSLAEAAGFA